MNSPYPETVVSDGIVYKLTSTFFYVTYREETGSDDAPVVVRQGEQWCAVRNGVRKPFLTLQEAVDFAAMQFQLSRGDR